MDLEVLEQKLRALPGVLDCSVSAEGVAVVVHPEVDPRLIEVQAQMLLGEAGDRRPLLVVGGMSGGPRVLPTGRAPRPRARRTGPSPASLVAFAVLVLGLLAVVPIANRDAGPERSASPAGRGGARSSSPSGLGRLPLDEAPEELVASGPQATPSGGAAEGQPGPDRTDTVDLGTVVLASASSPAPVESASTPSPGAVPASEPAPPTVTAAAGNAPTAKGKGRAASARGGHGGRSDEVRAAARTDAAVATGAAAKAGPPGKADAPGKADPPGRRRGHRR
ncbi:MAG TPA: hypothetical protein VHF47_07245 [Acidimicrobiales bacterium]|nr:hypothetical protein [Acidimicrobiales bacterium]